MNETTDFKMFNINNTCWACLGMATDVSPTTSKDIELYKSFVDMKINMHNDIQFCIFCAWMLNRFAKFKNQCCMANNTLHQMLDMDIKSFILNPLKSGHNISCTYPEVYSFTPNKCNNDDDKNNDMFYDDNAQFTNDSDEDEVPLVMLSKNELNTEYVKSKSGLKRRKRKKNNTNSLNQNGLDSDIKQELEIDQASDTRMCLDNVERKKNAKAELKDGFTSRMVQETEEYEVIKLTRDQVLQEMEEKSKNAVFLRSPYKCERCVKGFNFEDVLQAHMDKHVMENGQFHCDICTQYCPSAVSLRGHIKSHTTRYKCKLCGHIRLSRQHLLEHHAITHTSGAAAYTCEQCQFVTNKRTVMQRHVKTHASREPHACHRCGKLFKNIDSLRVHTLRHDKSKQLQCSQCGKRFVYPSLLQRHVLAVHVRGDYYCVECDVRFKSRESLRSHFQRAKRHRDSSAYKHECTECGKRFVSNTSLRVHESAAHGAARRHACGACARRYASAAGLAAHRARAHPAPPAPPRARPPPACHVCDKTFTRKSALRSHARTHTGERPHACACGAAFAQLATLRAHLAAKQHAKEEAPLFANKIEV